MAVGLGEWEERAAVRGADSATAERALSAVLTWPRRLSPRLWLLSAVLTSSLLAGLRAQRG